MPRSPANPKRSIRAEVCEDGGDWTAIEDVEAVVVRAVRGVAVHVPGPSATVSVSLSSDAAVSDLNGRYRGKFKPTNVLSFPPGPGHEPDFLGDIVFAAETVASEAQALGVPIDHHFQHLVVHGILHLLGFDHENDADAERMEALETQILASIGIADPYTEPLETGKKELAGTSPMNRGNDQ